MFHIDDAAAVIALDKGYSRRDQWATTICRAARVVAAEIGASLFAQWTPRTSSRETRVADNLTHNLLAELDQDEQNSYLERGLVELLKPIRAWMQNQGQT